MATEREKEKEKESKLLATNITKRLMKNTRRRETQEQNWMNNKIGLKAEPEESQK